MKQKDIALIAIMVFVGAVASFILSRVLFSSPQNRQQTAEVVDLISPAFQEPSPKYFNSRSINPAVSTQVGQKTAGQ